MEVNKDQGSQELVCIEYPGIVNNVDKMLDTLGGLHEVSMVYSERNRRLELRFRPDDIYCKPACGDRSKTNGILLKAKVLRKKNRMNSEEEETIVKSIEIIGRATTTFKFKSSCDFQFLPMEIGENGKMESLRHTLIPSRVDGDHILKWLEEPCKYFLPPAAFSRIDSMSNNTYSYRREAKSEHDTSGALIGRTRKRRSGHAIFVSFNVPNVPVKPREKALKFLELKMLSGHQLETVQKCFKERPIWSKLALMCTTGFQQDHLKYLLPAVAYYFVTGPFRIMWVRFGYDPRKDPNSRIYQTLDYRIRAPGGLLNLVKAKRSYANCLLPSKSSHSTAKSVVIGSDVPPDEVSDTTGPIAPDAFKFLTTKIPAARQMFYQYCDVKAPEIETMLARLPKVRPGKQCDPRLGWLPPNFDNQCREIINGHVIKLLKKEVKFSVHGEMYKDEEEIDDSSDDARWEEEFDDEDVDNESETGG
ncbi:hypothetical protein AAG570_001285 [Ranatra chinensis]|uniref:General transcription factor 3C polypeptide 5 n=1 Tax=Ranatra chinensis TaxID=642074 RepID=A0ABD0YBF0_9HEMI